MDKLSTTKEKIIGTIINNSQYVEREIVKGRKTVLIVACEKSRKNQRECNG